MPVCFQQLGACISLDAFYGCTPSEQFGAGVMRARSDTCLSDKAPATQMVLLAFPCPERLSSLSCKLVHSPCECDPVR